MFLETRKDSPKSSKPGLPALPIICLTSITGRGMLLDAIVLHLLVSLTTTLLAGKFTPCARVGVATIHWRFPFLNPFSITFLWEEVKPAWWKPTPPLTEFERAFTVAEPSSPLHNSCDIEFQDSTTDSAKPRSPFSSLVFK